VATETVELSYQQLLAIVLQATDAVEAHGKELELLHGGRLRSCGGASPDSKEARR
jgi:hypothetical protein